MNDPMGNPATEPMNPPSAGADARIGASLRQPWARLAEQWSRLGPPLRPCDEDLRRLHRAWMDSLRTPPPAREIRVLLLGVTPELACFRWSDRFHLTALDASEVMIAAVWPGDAPGRRAMPGQWLDMPLRDGQFDLVLCDGGLVNLSGPGLLPALGRELRRVLRPDGRVVMRHFARPGKPETTGALAREVGEGTLTNFNELKLRLLMALEADGEGHGVRLQDALECFGGLFPDRSAMAAKMGCDVAVLDTIDAYRGRDARYVFFSLRELAEAFDGFSLGVGPGGGYALADRCPVFCLVPRP